MGIRDRCQCWRSGGGGNSAWRNFALLGLAAARISDEQRAVVLQQRLLDCHLGLLINILLVVSDDSLADGLAQSCKGGKDQVREMRSAVVETEQGGAQSIGWWMG